MNKGLSAPNNSLKHLSMSRRVNSAPVSSSSYGRVNVKGLEALRKQINIIMEKTEKRDMALKIVFEQVFENLKDLENIEHMKNLLTFDSKYEKLFLDNIKNKLKRENIPDPSSRFRVKTAIDYLDYLRAYIRCKDMTVEELLDFDHHEFRTLYFREWILTHPEYISIDKTVETEYGDQSLFEYALADGNKYMIETLIEFGVELNNRINPLSYAFNWRDLDLMKLLMQYGEDPNSFNRDLNVYQYNRDLNVYQYVSNLVEHPTEYSVPYHWGGTPLTHRKMLKKMLKIMQSRGSSSSSSS